MNNRDVWRFVSHKWPYKLAALSLSILLWLAVSADSDIADQPVLTTLEIGVNDPSWSLVEVQPPQVRTIFRGERRELLTPLFGQPEIRKVLDQVTDSVMQVELLPVEVSYNRTLNLEAVAIDPPFVTVRLEERVRRRVPVAGRTDARAVQGVFVVGMQVAPDSVWIDGPASLVNNVMFVQTEELQVGRVAQSVSAQLAIELDFEGRELEVDPPTVFGTVHVDSLVVREFEPTVQSTGFGSANVILDPPSVTVIVTGPSSVITTVMPAAIGARVDVPEGSEDELMVPVQVVAPGNLAMTYQVQPARVRVIRGGDPDARPRS